MTEKKIVEIKRKKESNLKNKKHNLSMKFFIFFILIFALLSFFWFYLSCFGAVYPNTQIHLIKDTLISYGLSLFYPILTYLLPGLFRIPSLKSGNQKCRYRIGIILQIL